MYSSIAMRATNNIDGVSVSHAMIKRAGVMTIDIKLLSNTAKIPTHGSREAAGYDLYADISEDYVEIPPHETRKIGTGISVAIPDGYFGAIFPRSGLATKEGLRPANTPGCIDQDYRGEIMVALHNDTDFQRFVTKAERIAQLVVIPYATVDFYQVDKLNTTSRGEGGFGSTGMM